MMNKKAQKVMVGMMMGIFIFIVAMVLIQPVRESVDDARNETNMNCTSAEISSVDKATCTVLDVGFLFYFISVIIAIGIAVVAGKKDITGVLTSITIFIIVVVMITPLKSFIIIARDSTHLNCASTAITVGARMTCIFVDLWLFYFVVTVLAAAVTFIFVKRLKE